MILRNLAARLCAMLHGNSGTECSPEYIDTKGISTTSIHHVDLDYYLKSNNNLGNDSSSSYNGDMNSLRLCLGSGTTSPTFNDYKIEAPLDMSTLNLTAQSHSASNYKVTQTATIQNTGNTNFTFSEIVLAGYNSGVLIALTRDVVSPITIEAGKSKTVTVVIDFASMATSVA